MSKFDFDRREAGSPVTRFSDPDYWHLPAAIDPLALMVVARHERTAVTVSFFRVVGAALARLWRLAVAEPVRRWRARERTVRELSRLSERELIELGVAPGMLRFVASGAFRPDPDDRRAANENKRTQKAA